MRLRLRLRLRLRYFFTSTGFSENSVRLRLQRGLGVAWQARRCWVPPRARVLHCYLLCLSLYGVLMVFRNCSERHSMESA